MKNDQFRILVATANVQRTLSMLIQSVVNPGAMKKTTHDLTGELCDHVLQLRSVADINEIRKENHAIHSNRSRCR